jgi:hypothetical protein
MGDGAPARPGGRNARRQRTGQGAAEDVKASEHTDIQALLMRLGRKMGHKGFAAVGDQNRLSGTGSR